MTENAKPNTAPNNWRRLHALILKAKEAKDFETLGAAIEELAALEFRQKMTASATNDLLKLITGALWQARNKMCQWQDSPPPLGPVEAQIGPGHPDPPPPPPDKIVLTVEELYIVLNDKIENVVLRQRHREEYGVYVERLNALIAKKLSDANRHTIAHAKPWTAEEFDRLIDKPYYREILGSGILHERSALCARIINERCGLIDGDKPTEEKPLKATPEAVEAPNVERSTLHAETPGETLYTILQRVDAREFGSHSPIYGWPMVNAEARAYYERAAEWMFDVCRSKAEPVKPVVPWTGESFFNAYHRLRDSHQNWCTAHKDIKAIYETFALLANNGPPHAEAKVCK